MSPLCTEKGLPEVRSKYTIAADTLLDTTRQSFSNLDACELQKTALHVVCSSLCTAAGCQL